MLHEASRSMLVEDQERVLDITISFYRPRASASYDDEVSVELSVEPGKASLSLHTGLSL